MHILSRLPGNDGWLEVCRAESGHPGCHVKAFRSVQSHVWRTGHLPSFRTLRGRPQPTFHCNSYHFKLQLLYLKLIPNTFLQTMTRLKGFCRKAWRPWASRLYPGIGSRLCPDDGTNHLRVGKNPECCQLWRFDGSVDFACGHLL